jgi:DNA-binding NarL/FixJ family response regulator
MDVAEPDRLELAGDARGAAMVWRDLGFPYDSALAFMAAGDEESLRESLEELQRLDARAVAAIAARRLRELGVRSIPRGPRASTTQNPGNLTARELEVLRLMAAGQRNADIASRLVLSERTVDHHVSAILGKLGARTRGEAAAHASRMGLTASRG